MAAEKWLEKELARQLAPVSAPETLWDSISGRTRGRQAVASHRLPERLVYWPLAAAIVLAAVAGFWFSRNGSSGEDRFTEKEVALLERHQGVDFRADNFNDARNWVKRRANIDIDVPQGHPAAENGAVHVVGVRLAKLDGLPIAAVDYEVSGETATLYVSGKRAGLTSDDMGPSLHLHSRRGLTYWNMRNETYTIAFHSATNPHGACMLCHATPVQGDAAQGSPESQPGL